MVKHFVLLLATVLLLLQSSLAFHQTREISSNSSREEEDTPKNRMRMHVMEGYFDVANYVVIRSSKIYQKVIDEATTDPDSELKPHIDNLTDFVRKVNKTDSMSDENRPQQMLVLFADALSLSTKYDSTEVENPTNDILHMEKLLVKHGIRELNSDYVKRIHLLIEDLNTEVKEYIDSLTPEEKETEQKLIDWYLHSKDDKDCKMHICRIAQFMLLLLKYK